MVFISTSFIIINVEHLSICVLDNLDFFVCAVLIQVFLCIFIGFVILRFCRNLYSG